MAVDRQRLLELALGKLQAERDRIDGEITEIRGELSGSGTAKKRGPKKTRKAKSTRKKPRFSAAERKARSERMKQYWRDRKKKEKKSK